MYLYYEVKNDKKVVMLIKSEIDARLGDQYVEAELPELVPNARLLLDEENKPFYEDLGLTDDVTLQQRITELEFAFAELLGA